MGDRVQVSKVRAVGRVAALAGMLVASAGVFAGVSHADSDGDDGRGGTGHAKCKRGFLGLPSGKQCNSRNGAKGGSGDEGDGKPRQVSRSRDGDEMTREELADGAGGKKTRANLERERDRDAEAGDGNRHGRAGASGNARRIGKLERDRPTHKRFVAGSRGSYTDVYDAAGDNGGGLYNGSAY